MHCMHVTRSAVVSSIFPLLPRCRMLAQIVRLLLFCALSSPSASSSCTSPCFRSYSAASSRHRTSPIHSLLFLFTSFHTISHMLSDLMRCTYPMCRSIGRSTPHMHAAQIASNPSKHGIHIKLPNIFMIRSDKWNETSANNSSKNELGQTWRARQRERK